MEYLREGVWMRGFEQRDPLVIYKKEAFEMFNTLLNSIQDDLVNWMFHVVVRPQQQAPPPRRRIINPVPQEEGDEPAGMGAPTGPNGAGRTSQASGGPARRTGRNDPCPCGSGKKYKFCCLKSSTP